MDKKTQRRFSINKLQLKYTSNILVPILIILILTEIQFFIMIKSSLPVEQYSLIRVNLINTLIFIIIETIILCIIVAFVHLKFLNRLVGPFERLIREIEVMDKTKKYHLLKVREKDEIKPLIESFNKIISSLMQNY